MQLSKNTLTISFISVILLAGCNQNSTAKPTQLDKTANNDTKSLHNTAAQSSDPNNNAEVANALQANLNTSGVDVHVLSAVPSGVPDLFWVTLNGSESIFTDKTGKYIFQGSVVELGGEKPVDISAKLHSKNAKQALQSVDKSTMIVFPAQGTPKAAIYVFSDPTCHYCQKLHSEINETTKAGIEVRYLAWPRGEQMLPLTEAIWCSKDRNDAMTRAKKGEKITSDACATPIKEHLALGYSLGVSGTPAVFAENGVQLGGYLPSAELARMAIANKQ